jgi:endonuclease/exonuclease/phosphatase family metal-dependent hydrolase
MRALSWNLYHGRDFPPDPSLQTWRSRLLGSTELGETHAQVNRPLMGEFASWLERREWDVALLQEAPPRWLRPLAHRAHASGALALTSRNLLPAMRGRLADRNPDLLASNEGGSNQLLVRHPGRIVAVRRLTLTRRPERRRMLLARLDTPFGRLCVANLHATAGIPEAAAREVEEAAACAVEWTRGEPLLFGGDLNLRPRREPEPFARLRERFSLCCPTALDAIDHLLARGLSVIEPPRRLAPEERELSGPRGLRLRLSDHAPVIGVFGMR